MNRDRTLWALAILFAFGGGPVANAQEPAQDATGERRDAAEGVEEVIVIGRLYDATQRLMDERREDEVVSDVLGEAMISRLGDTTVAVALQRISGLSLVNNKFVYVRGLGERYSSTLLNGAAIPSPDLTRNVIPLDIFPTSIVQSLRVQKAYSADMPAAFGGGAVDIRTKGIPSGFTYAVEVGAGYNFENDGDAFTYPGGDDDRFGVDDGTRALAPALTDGITRFLGNLDVQGILTGLVYGAEIEGLKELGFLGTWAKAFFMQGNLTWQDSELIAGPQADAPTNNVRPLAGASDYVANVALGFDSNDGMHTATLAYNVFGERLYVAGRLGAPDGYEQPFHSLDLTYSWYRTENITVKAKLRNLLDEAVEIEREGVTVFTERPGSTASVSFQWEY